MSLLFWLDVAAYGISTVLATALALAVLGTGPRRGVNRFFALFTLAEAIWAASSLLMRLALWQEVGDPEFLLQVSTLAFVLMGPFLLSFAIRYIDRSARLADILGAAGLVAIVALSIPLFRDQLVSSPRLTETHSLLYYIAPWGYIMSAMPSLYFIWSLLLFWLGSRQTGRRSMAASALILLVGYTVGGLFQPPFPVMSVTTTISIVILGYGVVSQHLLNPTRELAVTLEHTMEERAQELAEAAIQLETANLALARRNTQLEAAIQVAREAAAIRNVGRLLNKTVSLISDRFGFYHAGIFLLDEARENAMLRAASSDGGKRLLARGHKLKIDQTGFVGSVASTGNSRIAHNVRNIAGEHLSTMDTASFTLPDLPLTRSEIALPLKIRGRVIGVLDVHSMEPSTFSDENAAILQLLADQVAMAIENARLLEEAETQFQQVDILLGRHGREGWKRLSVERPQWGYTYDGLDIVAHESGRDPETETVAEPDSQVTVPLQIRGADIGHLGLTMPDEPLTAEAMALARAIADQASQALENARLFQEAQRTLQTTEALYYASQAVGAATSYEEVGQTLIDYAASSGVDAARLLLMEYDERGNPTHIVMQEGWTVDDRPSQPIGTRLSLDEYPLLGFMDPHEPIAVENIYTDPRTTGAVLTIVEAISGLRSFAIVPISVGERWLGILFVGRSEPSAFSTELVRGYRTLTGQVAVAFESIRLLEETRQRAERERLIGDVTARMRETLDVERVLETATYEIRTALNLTALDVRIGTETELTGGDGLDHTPSFQNGHSDGTPSFQNGHSDGTPSFQNGHSDGTS